MENKNLDTPTPEDEQLRFDEEDGFPEPSDELSDDPFPSSEDDDDETEEEQPTVITVSRPVLNSMDDFIETTDKSLIVSEINEKIMDGTISRLMEAPLEKTLLSVSDVTISETAYWQLNSSDLLADLEVIVKVPEARFNLCITMWYNTEEEFKSEFQEISMDPQLPQRTLIKLDKYLIPIVNNEEIEDAGEAMWMKYDKSVFVHPEAKNPWNLMERMKLNLLQHRFFKAPKVHSSLFFDDGELLIQKYDPASPAGHKPASGTVQIPANTVVLNTSVTTYDERMADMYHECYHAENHAMFFRLQKMIQTDTSKVKRKTVRGNRDRIPPDVLGILEYQATRGSYALMLPRSVIKSFVPNKVQEIIQEALRTQSYYNAGTVFEEVIQSLSVTYHVPAWRVKRRLLQFGYLEAKGAHNYVDGRYIDPFAFTITKKTNIKDTYVINHKTLADLYFKDKKLQARMQSGDYVFVDGHVCANSMQFIKLEEGEARLTLWAKAHVDECCLRFTQHYDDAVESSSYTFGRVNSVEAYNRHYRGFLDRKGILSDTDYVQAKNSLVEAVLPLSFSKMLIYLMKYGNHRSERFTLDRLAAASHVSERTISRMRSGEYKEFKRDEVIAICFAMHLPSWLSTILLEKANFHIPRYGDDGYLGELLDCHFMDTIDEIQQYLKDNHYPPLAIGDEIK